MQEIGVEHPLPPPRANADVKAVMAIYLYSYCPRHLRGLYLGEL
jgi:hypothetical protein